MLEKLKITLFLMLTSLSVLNAQAERYLGISPNDRLTDVKRRLPNATYLESTPAWLQSHQRLIKLSGPGVEGVVGILFMHEADELASFLKQVAVKQANRGELSSLEAEALRTYPSKIDSLRASPPPDPWIVQEIRWQPSGVVLLKTLITRYGSPERDALNEQFQREVFWFGRGISADILDNESVQLLTFQFTFGDYLCSNSWKRGEECDPNPKRSPKPTVRPSRNPSPAASVPR